MNNLGWTVVHTEGSGRGLHERITELNYKTFFPQVRVTKVRRGVRHKWLAPLFPGYLFVYVWSNWRSLLEIKGVAGFLMCYAENAEDNCPAIVPQKTIDKVRSFLDVNDVLKSTEAGRFVAGQRVTPQVGLLEGWIGSYVSTCGNFEVVDMNRMRAMFEIGELVLVE